MSDNTTNQQSRRNAATMNERMRQGRRAPSGTFVAPFDPRRAEANWQLREPYLRANRWRVFTRDIDRGSDMDEESTKSDTTTALARERTREAADRTLMAWIRTDLSLITFGLGLGKAVELLDAAFPTRAKLLDPRYSTLLMAISLTGLGVVSLLGAIIQHGLVLRALKQATYAYKAPRALTLGVAVVLLAIGVLALAGLAITIT